MNPKENEFPHLMLLNGGIAEHHADWNWKNVSSPFARFYLVLRGAAKVILDGKACELSAGHMYIIPPFVLHSYECRGDFSHYYFHVYEKSSTKVRWMEEYSYPFELQASATDSMLFSRLLSVNPGMELHKSDPRTYDNPDMLIRTISESIRNPFHTRIETQGMLCQILARFLKYAVSKTDVHDDRIRQTLSYIRKNMDREIRIGELAGLCCLSEDHFIRLFRKELGDTPLEYVNKRKIEKAQLLLITTDRMVKDIAYGLSFRNISYFNRLFGSRVGMTPNIYRKVHNRTFEHSPSL